MRLFRDNKDVQKQSLLKSFHNVRKTPLLYLDAVRIMLQLLNQCLAHYTVITSCKEFKIFAKTLLKHVIKKSITCDGI